MQQVAAIRCDKTHSPVFPAVSIKQTSTPDQAQNPVIHMSFNRWTIPAINRGHSDGP